MAAATGRSLARLDASLAHLPPSRVALGSAAFALLGARFLAWFLAARSTVRERGAAWVLFSTLRSLPGIRGVVLRKRRELIAEMDADMRAKLASEPPKLAALPATGLDAEYVLASAKLRRGKDSGCEWSDGRSTMSGAVYMSDRKHFDVLCEVYAMYAHANPLHADAFPAVARMEAEIVAMTARMLGGGERAAGARMEPSSSSERRNPASSSSDGSFDRSGVCGLTTSGGTESILTAIRATRDYMRETRGITKPEMIAATSAHAAVYKAAEYFGIRLLIAPVDAHYRMDVAATRRLITRNTILLYASAPGYPHGAMDPVEALGALALRKKICLHVDACLGGFVMPFAGEAGEEETTLVEEGGGRRPAEEAHSGAPNGVAHPRAESASEYHSPAPPIAPFDFRVPGVTSMSVDTHKYGLAQKGSSVVLYSSPALRQRQYTAVTNWSGGLYISPTQAGSRSGGLIAQTWAALVHVGREGYRRNAAAVLGAAAKLRRGIDAIEGLTLIGSDATMVVAWGSADPTLNVYVVNDVMTKKGWHLSVLHAPAALHMCLTPANVGAVDALLEDLRDAVGEARRAGGRGVDGGKAPIYGLAGGLPDRGVVGDILKDVQDLMLENI